MVRRSSLCAECTQGLQESYAIPEPDEAVYSEYYKVSRNQTVETFRRAAEDGCFVCRTIWNQTEEHSRSWESVEASAWVGLSYIFWHFDYMSKKIFLGSLGFSVTYLDPISQSLEDTTFELVPTCCPQIENWLCPKRLQDSTSSKQTLDQALAWYEECISSHEECEGGRGGTPERDWLPIRLVDVGVEADEVWRLVLSAEDVRPQHPECPSYMTLSYRWGPNPRIRLLSSTMNEYRSGKPISDLPQTFKDFIKVARHFNIRYVWIDSICIVQDSINDWEQEAPMMASVYSNAACNVAAAAASDPEQGLFTFREPSDPRDEIVAAAISSVTATEYYALVNGHLHFSRQFQPLILRKRGWVFQEWFLSPRVLHFTREQAIWECCDGAFKSETFPFHQWDDYAKSDKISAKSLRAQLGPVPAGSELPEVMTDQCLDLWNTLVTRYSLCGLTDPKDKLFAFSGFAKRFMAVCGDAYYAGMWRTKLVYQLCWEVYEPEPRPACGYRAPSWSWASVDGMVTSSLRGVKQDWTYWAEVADVNVVTKTDDCTVGITGGYLRARGCVFGVQYYRYLAKEQIVGKHRITFDGKCWLRAKLSPDTTENDFGEIGCLQLLVLMTRGEIERDGYDDADWRTGEDSLDGEEEGSELSWLATVSMDTSTDEDVERPDDESTKNVHVEEGAKMVSEDDTTDVNHGVDEGQEYIGEGLEDDYQMNDDGCLICETADADFNTYVPETICLVIEPAEALGGVGQKTYRRVGWLRTESDACCRHMLLEIMRQSPQEIVLV